MRIDRLLWFLRFARSRGAAQKWLKQGHIRCNRKRIEKLGHLVRPGDVLTLPLARQVLVIEIERLPKRRGPIAEARSHYRELDPAHKTAIGTSNEFGLHKD